MATPYVRHTFVLGVGFPVYVGMLLQQQFTSALLSSKDSRSGQSAGIVQPSPTILSRRVRPQHERTGGLLVGS
jgi:hypothetical protein